MNRRNQILSQLTDPVRAKEIMESGEAQSLWLQWYLYEWQTLALAPAGNATVSINIQSDADFIATKLTYFADIAAAAQTDSTRVIPLVTIQITDTGSNRQQFDAPIAIPAVLGTGELPYMLPVSQRYRRNSSINCDFVNFDAAVTYNLRLYLHGWKVFQTGPGTSIDGVFV